MTEKTIYLLDANVLIQSAKGYYAFDLVPSFWTALLTHAEQGRIQSLDRVKAEIDRQNDDLQSWSDRNFRQYYQSSVRSDVLGNYKAIIRWGYSSGHYRSAAKRELADAKRADAWLVAYAMAEPNIVLVTNELDNPLQKNKVPIPSVCAAFRVPWIDPFDMLRQLNVSF